MKDVLYEVKYDVWHHVYAKAHDKVKHDVSVDVHCFFGNPLEIILFKEIVDSELKIKYSDEA